MITDKTLHMLASTARAVAEEMEDNDLAIAADRARGEASAANGMGTWTTLMLSIELDNNRGTQEEISEIVTMSASVADLAVKLRVYVEAECSHVGETSPVAEALLKCAIENVDWMRYAEHLLEERAHA